MTNPRAVPDISDPRRRRAGAGPARGAISAGLLRLLLLLALSAVALQAVFAARIALMAVLDPQSTSFQRSEAWRLIGEGRLPWAQQWVDHAALGWAIQRAVIASEDAGFVEHSGVEWDALEQAWERNQRAQAQAERANARAREALQRAEQRARERAEQKAERLQAAAARRGQQAPEVDIEAEVAQALAKVKPPPAKTAKVVGGSTISQQLAKNLFLSGERTALRKAQEFVLTLMLEALLDKRRILTVYLNSVEFGEGIFGAQAAAQHYFRTDVARLDARSAAKLAVLLPAPRRFQQRFQSPYLNGRAATIAARMPAVELP